MNDVQLRLAPRERPPACEMLAIRWCPPGSVNVTGLRTARPQVRKPRVRERNGTAHPRSAVVTPPGPPEDEEPRELTAAELAGLKRKLERIRTTLAERLARPLDATSTNTGDEGELGQREAHTLAQAEARRRDTAYLASVQRALGRIRRGTYGTCVDTAEPIGVRRLEAVPTALRSREAEERYQRTRER